MKETIDSKILWSEASKTGLVLGGVSILYTLISSMMGGAESGLVAGVLFALGTLLWIIKFAACLFLMRFFMLRFSQADPTADNNRVFKFGMLTALLSALLYSAFYLAYTSFIAPDTFDTALEILRDNPYIDSNSMEQVEEMIPRMPTIAFFMNLVYCWLFGTVLAAIYSRNIPSQNPFNDQQS